MQRFLRIGDARVQVVSAVMHDPRGTERALASIASLHPEALLLDRSVAEWTQLDKVDAFQKAVLETVPGLRANALWRGVDHLAPRINAKVALLHQQVPAAPASAIRDLRRLLTKEGFDASGDPRRDVAKLHAHYVRRVPALWQALEERRDRSAARLRAAFETRPRRAVVVLAAPDADEVCDRIQQLGR